jgi:hypothetical protein
MTPSCKTCIHWQPVPADPMNLGAPRFGTCLRFPPVAYPINDRQSVNVRPQTVEGDRCGEWLETLPAGGDPVALFGLPVVGSDAVPSLNPGDIVVGRPGKPFEEV